MLKLQNQVKKALLLSAAALLAFTACSRPSGDGSGRRTRVKDGRFITYGIGNSVHTPITVATTFVNNTIVDISIGANRETPPILDTVKKLMLPRIVGSQSTGVDAISGATLSSLGVRTAVEAAIEEAGGKAAEWRTTPPRSDNKVVLSGYDVIVVGLGGSGTTAYLKAAENANLKVFGIEAAGKTGGTSAQAGGPMAVNSSFIKTLYGLSGDYVDRDALLQQWYADMQAEVPAAQRAGLERTRFTAPNNNRSYDLPKIGQYGTTPPYEGGPKWEIIKKLIDESGQTVTWLGRDYQFNFERPSGLSFPMFTPVTNYGRAAWIPGTGYQSDNFDMEFIGGTMSAEFNNRHKAVMFANAVEKAKARNKDNDYMLELRARKLHRLEDGRITVEADYRNGTATYMITGKAVILGTGGYIGNRDMKLQYFGGNLREDAVLTSRGDGITMAMSDMNAAPYNIDTPGMVHESNILNIVRTPVSGDPGNWKPTLTSLLLKPDNIIVGMNKGNSGANPYSGLPDLRGRRFANEAAGGLSMESVAFMNWKAGGFFAAIFDNDEIARMKSAGAKFTAAPLFHGQGAPIGANTAIADIDDILAMGERHGNVVRMDTLEKLAVELGIPSSVLMEEITKYNGYVDAAAGLPGNSTSADPEYAKAANSLTTKVKLGCASGYTAILGAGYYYGTTAGVDVDDQLRVLDADRRVIPGLYAVGQDSAGVLFHAQKAYVGYGAAAQGWAITSGRLAGQYAAEYAAGFPSDSTGRR